MFSISSGNSRQRSIISKALIKTPNTRCIFCRCTLDTDCNAYYLTKVDPDVCWLIYGNQTIEEDSIFIIGNYSVVFMKGEFNLLEMEYTGRETRKFTPPTAVSSLTSASDRGENLFFGTKRSEIKDCNASYSITDLCEENDEEGNFSSPVSSPRCPFLNTTILPNTFLSTFTISLLLNLNRFIISIVALGWSQLDCTT